MVRAQPLGMPTSHPVTPTWAGGRTVTPMGGGNTWGAEVIPVGEVTAGGGGDTCRGRGHLWDMRCHICGRRWHL